MRVVFCSYCCSGKSSRIVAECTDCGARQPYLELVVYPALPLTSLCVVGNIYLSFLLFVVIHTVKGFSIVNKAEVDVFLEFSCFFYDLTDVRNLISDFSAFSKSSLYICKFSVHILFKPSLKDFEHYLDSI